MGRIEILENSLKKKEGKFNEMLNNHFETVGKSNGQPLNDKRNGKSTLRKWENQNNALLRQQNEIEKTKKAIKREISKKEYIANTKESMPTEILNLIEDGTLKQWGKYPYIMFVDGVDKARIIWDIKKKRVMHKFTSSITDRDQFRKFASIYNSLSKQLNNK